MKAGVNHGRLNYRPLSKDMATNNNTHYLKSIDPIDSYPPGFVGVTTELSGGATCNQDMSWWIRHSLISYSAFMVLVDSLRTGNR